MRHALVTLATLSLVVSLLEGCGESKLAPPPADPTWVGKAASQAAPEPRPSNTLPRSQVREVVREGLGQFLQRVDLDVDHPVMKGGKFYGYRIVALKGDPSFWDGVDLAPGDVVVRVNGFSVGNENDAHEAFSSLDVASELSVQYERAGVARELRYAIVDDR